ncbi:15147_t:CDS:10, partial [Entrophospora sp. SA101]
IFATEYKTSASSQNSHQSSSTSLSNPCPALTADELALAECIEVIEAGVKDVIINKANEKEKMEFEKKCERANASKFWEYENGTVTIIELPRRDHEIAHGEFSKQFLSAFHNVHIKIKLIMLDQQSDSSFVPKFLPKPAQYPSDSEGNPWLTIIIEVANTQTFASIIQKTTQFWLAPNQVEDVIILKLWNWDSSRDQNGTPLRCLTVQYCFVVSFHLFHRLIIVLYFGSAINSVIKQTLKCMGITNQLKWYELIEFGTIDRSQQPYGGCSAPGIRTLSISPHCIYKGCAHRNPPLSPYPIANNVLLVLENGTRMFPFNSINEKKQSFVDKTRAEREQREKQRKLDKLEKEKTQAAKCIQVLCRKRLEKSKVFENLRKLWDVEFLVGEQHEIATITTTDILRSAVLLFAFFDPNKDFKRFEQICKMILSTVTSIRPSKTTQQQNKSPMIPFHCLLLNEHYSNITLKILQKTTLQSVNYVVGYLNKQSNVNISSSRSSNKNDNIYYNKELYLSGALFLRVNLIMVLKNRLKKVVKLGDEDEKKLQLSILWITACIRFCLFPFDIVNASNDIIIGKDQVIINDGASNNNINNQKNKKKFSEKDLKGLFTVYIMSTPCLVSVLDNASLEILKRYNIHNKIISVLCNVDKDNNNKVFEKLTGNDAIFLLGNIVELFLFKLDFFSIMPASSSSKDLYNDQESLQLKNDFIKAMNNLLQHCQKFISSKQSAKFNSFHPIFSWYAGKIDSILLSNGSASSQITLMAIDVQSVCQFYNLFMKIFNSLKREIIMNLTYLPNFVPCLWRFLSSLGPKQKMKIFLTESIVRDPDKEPMIEILELFCECYDEELYELETPFSIEIDLIPMVRFFNKFCFLILILLQLHSRDTRRSFTISNYKNNGGKGNWKVKSIAVKEEGEDNIWLLIKDPKKSLPISLANFFKKALNTNNNNGNDNSSKMGSSFLERIQKNDEVAIRILNLLPHTIPFETRLDIFRQYLSKINNTHTFPTIIHDSSNCTVVKVRRGHVVEDGFKYLGGLSSARIQGKIFVKFVNEMGIAEEGIDQGGPFKEFMTQLIAEDNSYVYPSSSNSKNSKLKSLLITKANVYRFLGCMLARSIQEGILVDIQFARFFLSKLSGRGVFLEDLAGLNDELLKNLMFLKRYDDLSLYFSVDEEIDDKIISKDLKHNGSHIKVTNDNRIQYIYLMANYKLNQQTKEQTESFINGRCTEYKEGYFDQHPCIRNFWSILEDFKSNDKKALLKFVTSCSKPPLGGFKFLTPKFTICKVSIVLESDSPLSTTTPNSNNLSSNLRQVKSLFSSISSNLKTSVTNTSKARLPTSSTW